MWQKVKSFLFENKSAKQTIAKNTAWLTISNFGGRIIKAAIIIYGARVLGAAGYGVFSYAVTLAGFFTLFVDPGINSVLVREGAKGSPEERQSIFSTTFIMKAIIIVASMIIVITVAPLFSTLPGAKILLPFVALIIVFDSVRGFFASVFDAEEKMEMDAASFLATNLGILIFGFAFFLKSPTPLAFTSAYAAGTAVGALVAVWLLRDRLGKMLTGASAKRMVSILKTAWPFAVTGALGFLLTNTDILVISWMRTAAEVGIYAAAIRIVQVLYLVPAIIQTSTLPILSRFAKRDPLRFRITLERTISLVFLVSIPLSLGGAILGNEIMRLVFGAGFLSGGTAFSILMISLSFDFTATVVANAVFAYDHQKSLIVCSLLGGIGNVLFDLILIPHWGMAGSAVATLIAQILSNSYLWYAMKKLNQFTILPRIRKIGTAGAGMAAVTALLLAAHVNVILNVAVSGLIYFSLLIFLKEPLLEEIKEIVGAKPVVA